MATRPPQRQAEAQPPQPQRQTEAQSQQPPQRQAEAQPPERQAEAQPPEPPPQRQPVPEPPPPQPLPQPSVTSAALGEAMAADAAEPPQEPDDVPFDTMSSGRPLTAEALFDRETNDARVTGSGESLADVAAMAALHVGLAKPVVHSKIQTSPPSSQPQSAQPQSAQTQQQPPPSEPPQTPAPPPGPSPAAAKSPTGAPAAATKADTAAIVEQGRVALNGGRWAEARERFAAALKIDPRNRPVRALYHVASGHELRARGQDAQATLQFETALAHDRECEEARRALQGTEEKKGIFRRFFDR
jgi:hypothetical protein